MKPIVESSEVLSWMIDQGCLPLDRPETSYVFWAAYRCTLLPMRTAPIMVGALSNVVVCQVAADLERAYGWPMAYAWSRARLWADLAGDCLANGDLGRGSYTTYRLLVGCN